jgi:hypothetical protein
VGGDPYRDEEGYVGAMWAWWRLGFDDDVMSYSG